MWVSGGIALVGSTIGCQSASNRCRRESKNIQKSNPREPRIVFEKKKKTVGLSTWQIFVVNNNYYYCVLLCGFNSKFFPVCVCVCVVHPVCSGAYKYICCSDKLRVRAFFFVCVFYTGWIFQVGFK